jgi:hypothetical protein
VQKEYCKIPESMIQWRWNDGLNTDENKPLQMSEDAMTWGFYTPTHIISLFVGALIIVGLFLH